MKRLAIAAALALSFATPAQAKPPSFNAYVSTLPEVQRVGNSYLIHLTVKRTSQAWISKFCIDFGDSNNSWKIIMPGMTAYDGDTFCYGTLRAKTKNFYARLIPAKTGEKKLEVCFGHADIFKDANNAVIDENGRCWSESYVLV